MNYTSRLCTAIAACVLVTQTHAGTLRIDVSLADDAQALELRYQPPAGVGELSLPGQTTAVQAWWARQAQAGDECAELLPGRIRLREGCSAARVLVRAGLLSRWAHYEPAQPIGERGHESGLISYVGYWLAVAPGHDLQVRLHPPAQGHLLWQGQWTNSPAQWQQRTEEVDAAMALRAQGHPWLSDLGGHQTVYLGRAPSRAIPGGGRLVFDPRLRAETVDAVESTLKAALTLLTEAFGEGPGGPVGVIIAQTPGRRWHGDTTDGRTMRLSLGVDSDNDLSGFVRHETVHWWNAGVRRSDPHAPWLHEGGAEWWSLRLGVAQAAMSADAAAAALERGLNRCLMTAAQLPALREWRSHNGATYPCGLSLMALAQALRNPQGMGLRDLAGMYSRDAVLDAEGLASWAGPGFSSVLHATSFAKALADAYVAAGWADAEALSDPPSEPQASTQWLSALMAADCNGGYGFFTDPDRLRLDGADALRCNRWPTRGEVVTLEGVEAVRRPQAAHAALVAACAAGGDNRYRLGLGDGREIHVACPNSLPAAPWALRLHLKPGQVTRWFAP